MEVKLVKYHTQQVKFTGDEITRLVLLFLCKTASRFENTVLYSVRRDYFEKNQEFYIAPGRDDQPRMYRKSKAIMGVSYPKLDAELDRVTTKRNNQMRDAINKTARFLVNHCQRNKIGTVVFGWNPGHKDGANMGRMQNQQFVQIPTGRLKDRVRQLCEEYGIRFVETEEAYTSKASFLDGDSLPRHGEKPSQWKASGKRVQRGLYRASNGQLVNADCNGAANILRKVSTQLGIVLTKVSTGALNLPQRYSVLSDLTRFYRGVVQASLSECESH